MGSENFGSKNAGSMTNFCVKKCRSAATVYCQNYFEHHPNTFHTYFWNHPDTLWTPFRPELLFTYFQRKIKGLLEKNRKYLGGKCKLFCSQIQILLYFTNAFGIGLGKVYLTLSICSSLSLNLKDLPENILNSEAFW